MQEMHASWFSPPTIRHDTIMSEKSVRYTVRGVPWRVDQALRQQAEEQRKSLNQVVLEALERQAGRFLAVEPEYSDLDELAGSWVEDPEFDAALAAQDLIDENPRE